MHEAPDRRQQTARDAERGEQGEQHRQQQHEGQDHAERQFQRTAQVFQALEIERGVLDASGQGLQAFRQRAIKGDLPEFDETGKKIDYDSIFSSDPAAMWLLPNGVEMWESSGSDLTPILESVKADVRELAGRTRTPLYYLFPNEGGSAEGAFSVHPEASAAPPMNDAAAKTRSAR